MWCLAAVAFAAIHAPPGGTITKLAVTPGEDAAVTTDSANEVRLWPTLDGTAEPVVVDLPAGTALAIVRTPDGFAIADALPGGVIVARVDAAGQILGHAELPPVTRLAAAAGGAGFLAWRGRSVDAVDPSGAVHPADPKAAAARTKLTAKASDLVIPTPAGARYLGYAVPANARLEIAGEGAHRVLGNGDRWLRVDDSLARTADLPLWTPPHDHVVSLAWLGGDAYLGNTHAGVVVLDPTAGTGHVAFSNAAVAGYEPTTHLALLDKRRVARFHPEDGSLSLVKLPPMTPQTELELVARAAATGPELLLVERSYQPTDHLVMTWLHDVDHPAQGATSVRLEDTYQTAWDRAGDVFTAPLADAKAGTAYADGQVVGHAASLSPVVAPDGRHHLAATDAGTSYVAADGTVGWEKPLVQYDLHFLDAAHLVYEPHDGGGVAMIDLATGAMTALHTGWGFELGTAPHVASTVGRPLARTLATDRGEVLALAGDGAFQALARKTALASNTTVLEWGQATLAGRATRFALLKRPGESGTPLFAYLIETAPGQARAISVTGWGFSEFQGLDTPDHPPPWGEVLEPDNGFQHRATLALTSLGLGTRWIHMSFEQLEIGLAHGEPVLVSDQWAERENNGHGIDTTTGGASFPAGKQPELAAAKLHAMRIHVSAPAGDAEALAAEIYEAPPEP